MTAAMGVGLGLVAALAAAFGVMRLADPGDLGPFTWAASGKALLITIASATFGVGLPAVWIGTPWEIVPPLIVVIVFGVAFLLRGFRTRPAQARFSTSDGRTG
jgi:hypothetical protein